MKNSYEIDKQELLAAFDGMTKIDPDAVCRRVNAERAAEAHRAIFGWRTALRRAAAITAASAVLTVGAYAAVRLIRVTPSANDEYGDYSVERSLTAQTLSDAGAALLASAVPDGVSAISDVAVRFGGWEEAADALGLPLALCPLLGETPERTLEPLGVVAYAERDGDALSRAYVMGTHSVDAAAVPGGIAAGDAFVSVNATAALTEKAALVGGLYVSLSGDLTVVDGELVSAQKNGGALTETESYRTANGIDAEIAVTRYAHDAMPGATRCYVNAYFVSGGIAYEVSTNCTEWRADGTAPRTDGTAPRTNSVAENADGSISVTLADGSIVTAPYNGDSAASTALVKAVLDAFVPAK